MSERNWQIEHFETIGSTNAYLLGRALEGAPGDLVAVADHQTAGRGRLDRRWESPAGSSLLISVLIRERLSADTAHLLTAAMALAGVTAVERLCGVRPGLKWPNDLVAGGAKLAGILAEADASAPGGPPETVAVVVGMGMNLTWTGPPGAGGTSVEEISGVVVERDLLVGTLLAELAERLELIASSAGRAALSAQVEASLVTLGQAVTVTTASGSISGVAVGLSDAGHLLVETADGPVEIITGDVERLRSRLGGSPGAE
jgi:BirA family biotin operon repressor/biotin-[acetyl-CoA-carboxylase] ligase